jgi:hypothetical protein
MMGGGLPTACGIEVGGCWAPTTAVETQSISTICSGARWLRDGITDGFVATGPSVFSDQSCFLAELGPDPSKKLVLLLFLESARITGC